MPASSCASFIHRLMIDGGLGTGVKIDLAAGHVHGFGVARHGPWIPSVNKFPGAATLTFFFLHKFYASSARLPPTSRPGAPVATPAAAFELVKQLLDGFMMSFDIVGRGP